MNEKDKAILRMTEFPEATDIVEYRILGWMERSLEI